MPTIDDWIDLQNTPLDTAKAIAFVLTPAAGGINIFLGTTRAETNSAGHQLIALDYEAYETMARRQLQQLATSACEKWPIVRLVILHRIGRVPIAEPSVVIAVSTPHRAQAFEACRFLIDELKKEVTIWKQEIWTTGEHTWVDPTQR